MTANLAIERARAVLRDAAARLTAAEARAEALAEIVHPRPVLGIRRPPRMRRLGRAWRLGPVLLEPDGTVWAAGTTTRVAEPGRPQHLSADAELRRAHRAIALRSGFALGESVNHDIRAIDLDALSGTTAPLLIADGDVLVRWGTDAPVPLARFVTDVTELLVDPPSGSTGPPGAAATPEPIDKR